MSKNYCGLCKKQEIKSGFDKLFYEDKSCYIIDNKNTNLKIKDKLKFAKRRFSLIVKEHKKDLTKNEERIITSKFSKFLWKMFGLKEKRDYFFKVTMGTYPYHYHIHAYIPPFSDKGKIIQKE